MILKFMNKNHFRYILDENSIVVRRASYYRRLFEQTGDEWIGDPEEGISRLSLDHFVSKGPNDPQNIVALRMGILLCGGNGTIQNARSSKSFDHFLFCAASGNFQELQPLMYQQSDRNPTPYDGCLALVDGARFLACIAKGEARDMKGRRVLGYFRVDTFRPVIYADEPADAKQREHSPLIKRKMFQEQKEIRMVFAPFGERDPFSGIDSLKLISPGIGACFRQIDPKLAT